MGAGWCYDLEDCLGRSKTDIGTADFSYGDWAKEYTGNSKEFNPELYDYSLIWLHYCDGASFSGKVEEPVTVDGTPIYFRGHYIKQAVFEWLKDNVDFYNATDLVVSGCSSGSLATYINIDWYKHQINPYATVTGIADSGFFLNYNSPGTLK